MKDLVTINEQSRQLMGTPQDAAAAVAWMGLSRLPVNTVPEMLDDETPQDYTRRVWRQLSPRVKSEAIYTGLQTSTWYRTSLQDGAQLLIFRAYRDKMWQHTAEDLGDDDKSFRMWVIDVMTGEDTSPTEATQLASTILNLVYLSDNGYDGMPENIESIFADRSVYNRWRRVASGLRRLIENENDEKIQEIVDTVNDPGKTTTDLDAAGKVKAQLPPAVLEITGRDDAGLHLIEGTISDSQLTLLRSRTKGVADWILQGETYEGYELVRYRFNDLAWHEQFWNGTEWTDWDEVTLPRQGVQEGVPLEDKDLGVTYILQWEPIDTE